MKSRVSVSTMLLIIIISLSQIQLVYGASESIGSNFIVDSNSSESKVKKLQALFNSLGLYNGKIDGNYDSIKDDIIDYQLKYKIIDSVDSIEAGVFGLSTIKSIKANFTDKYNKNKDKEEEKKPEHENFIVTAYYSPLPNQRAYITGSYAGDIRLNGNGTNGASGKEVHAGFLAAPRTYGFGTKIELLGLGVGIVEDRGGAIVNAGQRGYEHDRIDVWMGYGDKGLQRAKKWGKRTVIGNIVPQDTELTIEFEIHPLDKYANLKVEPESKEKEVKELQKLFSEVNLYDGSINGKYKSIERSLLNYQKKKGIIVNDDDWGGGYFGPITMVALREDFHEFLDDKNENTSKLDFSLNDKQKQKMNKIREDILNYISKKTNGANLRSKSYVSKIKKKLDIYIKKVDNQNKKMQLEYLHSIL